MNRISQPSVGKERIRMLYLVLLQLVCTVVTVKGETIPPCPSQLRVRSLSQVDVYPVSYFISHLAQALSLVDSEPLRVWYDFEHTVQNIHDLDPCIFDIVIIPARDPADRKHREQWRNWSKELIGVAINLRNEALKNMKQPLLWRNWDYQGSWWNDIHWPSSMTLRQRAASKIRKNATIRFGAVPLRFKRESGAWIRRPLLVYLHNAKVGLEATPFRANDFDLVLSPVRDFTEISDMVPVGHYVDGAAKGFLRMNELQLSSYPQTAYNPSNLVSAKLPSKLDILKDNPAPPGVMKDILSIADSDDVPSVARMVPLIIGSAKETHHNLSSVEALLCEQINDMDSGICYDLMQQSILMNDTQIHHCPGSWLDSISCLVNYKFVIVVEPQISPGLVSERLFAAKLAQIVPIYVGAPDVANFVNSSSFVTCDIGKFTEVGGRELVEAAKHCVWKVQKLYQNPVEYQKMVHTPLLLEDKWKNTRIDGKVLAEGVASLIRYLSVDSSDVY